MFFMLRSAFWLSLVFAALPETKDIAAFSAHDLASQAGRSIESLCAQNPQSCMAALSKLAALDPATAPSTLGTPLAKPTLKSVKSLSNQKIGTLNAGDLALAWHAPTSKM